MAADTHEAVAPLLKHLDGMIQWAHPDVHRLHGGATAASVIGMTLAAVEDPNLVWDDLSQGAASAEMEVAAMVADLMGFDPAQASGIFTFGGTGTTLYGVRLGIEKAQPGAFHDGVNAPMRVFASDVAHYAKLSSAGWLGLGMNAMQAVPTTDDNAMDLDALEQALRATIEDGRRIACIVATAGSTDAFGVDDVGAIAALRDHLTAEYKLDYRPHLHVDAVVGWSYRAFSDYDFEVNPLALSPRARDGIRAVSARMEGLQHADSIGIDFHKSGWTSYMSSLFLVRNHQDFDLVSRERDKMPYLFQFGRYDPGMFTLECSRSAGPVFAALANLRLFGREGLQTLVGHCVEMAEDFKTRLDAHPRAVVLNPDNHGASAVFRVYPPGIDTEAQWRREQNGEDEAALAAHNEYNRRFYFATRKLADAGQAPLFVLTDRYRANAKGSPIVGIKCFTLSPFTDPAALERAVDVIDRVRPGMTPERRDA
jgi:glutamate/tyrosine decarboxylase-like PLP-dependent enzyme